MCIYNQNHVTDLRNKKLVDTVESTFYCNISRAVPYLVSIENAFALELCILCKIERAFIVSYDIWELGLASYCTIGSMENELDVYWD